MLIKFFPIFNLSIYFINNNIFLFLIASLIKNVRFNIK